MSFRTKTNKQLLRLTDQLKDHSELSSEEITHVEPKWKQHSVVQIQSSLSSRALYNPLSTEQLIKHLATKWRGEWCILSATLAWYIARPDMSWSGPPEGAAMWSRSSKNKTDGCLQLSSSNFCSRCCRMVSGFLPSQENGKSKHKKWINNRNFNSLCNHPVAEANYFC